MCYVQQTDPKRTNKSIVDLNNNIIWEKRKLELVPSGNGIIIIIFLIDGNETGPQ